MVTVPWKVFSWQNFEQPTTWKGIIRLLSSCGIVTIAVVDQDKMAALLPYIVVGCQSLVAVIDIWHNQHANVIAVAVPTTLTSNTTKG